MPVLSIILFLPSVTAVAILLFGRGESGASIARALALLGSAAAFLLSLTLWAGFDAATAQMQFAEAFRWLPSWGISYRLGVDGMSLLYVILTTFLTPIVVLAGFSAVERRVPLYMASLLFLETGMLGAFLATDLVLFYIFWEAMLIPMYLLIGVWGGERRIYAAVKFFLYTMAGSVLMLLAIVALAYLHYESSGEISFNLAHLLRTSIAYENQRWLFGAFAFAFAIKVPLFPLHTWLPDAHVEAPTGGSVILAGVLLKLGTYGLVRFAFPLFPAAAVTFAPWLSLLAVIGVIYGALVALVQPDIKKLVAYSSVSHLGFCVLGICAFTPEALEGALYQGLNHGLSTGALFLLVGVLYERRHTREIAQFGGLAKVIPLYAAALVAVSLSSIALPGTNGFVGEFLILLGTFTGNVPKTTYMAAGAALGVILGAVYMLWTVQRVLFGPVTHAVNEKLPDLTKREQFYLAPVLVLIFIMGVVPGPFLKTFKASTKEFLDRFSKTAVLASLPEADASGRAQVSQILSKWKEDSRSEVASADSASK
ncbi:MAG: NADH-quinone oxidoreductase subunit M [Bdellovibrionota bacterium]